VERARHLAREHRKGSQDALGELRSVLSGLPATEARTLVRAFSAYFSLVNMAERVHRIRRGRDYLARGVPQPGGLEAALTTSRSNGLTPQCLSELLSRLRITPVFTAHPTEATRRTLLTKEQRVARVLLRRMTGNLVPREQAAAADRLREEITLAWQTEEHLHDRPTVADEVEHVIFYLTDVIYEVVPDFYRSIEDAIARTFGDALPGPVPAGIISFGTWVGGDMDGNPSVGSTTMTAALERQRGIILDRYLREVRELFGRLSQSRTQVQIDVELDERVDAYRQLMPEIYADIPGRYRSMPYRTFLWLIGARLQATQRDAPGAYENPEELTSDLTLIVNSLGSNKGEHGGTDLVRALLRRVETFGLHVATLDIRQDALVHRRAVGQLLGRDDFENLSAEDRTELLSAVLARGHDPGLPPACPDESELAGVMRVMAAIRRCRRRFGTRSIGPYIISRAQGVDDVLAVLWLARRARLVDGQNEVSLDVAPLFETVEDLQRSREVMVKLFAHPQYRSHLRSRQDTQLVMLGYSDSSRESGLLASRWALQRAQEDLVHLSKESRIRLTLFHGRGGTISRGGSKPRNAILAEPQGAIDGHLRLTEQGEIIHAKYGLRDLALRTLELMGGAVIETSAAPAPTVPDRWREVLEFAAQVSRSAYRDLVFKEPDFARYFRDATPIDVIERLCIGSRPVARGSRPDIQNLRAIPWVFAWTQSRHMLVGWYGTGHGLQAAAARFGPEVLQEMARDWPFFENILGDAEMVLAKADMTIAGHYARLAESVGERFFSTIEQAYATTRHVVCHLRGHETLLQEEPVLQRAIGLRNPYVDPMSMVQIDLLQRWRAGDRKDQEIERALKSTVMGIARGLLNTG
jgi:phosphoenolpyruvate carboxylase